MQMTTEEALDIVSSETERSLNGLKHGVDRQKISIALTKVENAVHRLIRIENELAHLIRKNDDDLNGASSIVMEDDSVRGES